MIRNLLWRMVAALAALCCSTVSALAQDQFPSREITLVVSYSAGGGTDLVARIVAKRLEKALGGTVIIRNLAGGQGTIGQDSVRRAKPDGYTLAVVTTSSTALSPYQVANVYKPTDFDYVGGIGMTRFGLAVKADSPYKTINELVEAGRLKPLFFGTSSAVITIGFSELSKKSGAKFDAVNYKSGAESITALVGDQIAAVIQAPGEVLPHVQSGRVRLLASAGATRWPGAPTVPTLREAGFDVMVESLIGVAVPKGVPLQVMNKLQSALRTVAADPSLAAELDVLGVEPLALSGTQFAERMQAAFVAAEPLMKAVSK